jgi:hypothetical protein
VNIAALITLILGTAGVWYAASVHDRLDENVSRTRESVRALGAEITRRALLEDVPLSEGGWPATIDPAWFEAQKMEPPRNPLLSEKRPWIEIAGSDEALLEHPMVRADPDSDRGSNVAAFWYNPYRGIVRARVPMGLSDREGLALYNEVNGTTLTTLIYTPPVVSLYEQREMERKHESARVQAEPIKRKPRVVVERSGTRHAGVMPDLSNQ